MIFRVRKFIEDAFLFNESFDTSFHITKKETRGSIEFFYIDIKNKQYRIFIEDISKNLHIGFEQYYEDKNRWGVTNDLSGKDVLSIFGTIKKLLLTKKFYSVNISTKEFRKHGLYKRMMEKLTDELNSNGRKFEFVSNVEYMFFFDINKGYSPPLFQYN